MCFLFCASDQDKLLWSLCKYEITWVSPTQMNKLGDIRAFSHFTFFFLEVY